MGSDRGTRRGHCEKRKRFFRITTFYYFFLWPHNSSAEIFISSIKVSAFTRVLTICSLTALYLGLSPLSEYWSVLIWKLNRRNCCSSIFSVYKSSLAFSLCLRFFRLNFYQFNKANFIEATFNGESSGENRSKVKRKEKSENCGPMKQEVKEKNKCLSERNWP